MADPGMDCCHESVLTAVFLALTVRMLLQTGQGSNRTQCASGLKQNTVCLDGVWRLLWLARDVATLLGRFGVGQFLPLLFLSGNFARFDGLPEQCTQPLKASP